jgi:hypothetical protein
MRNRLGAGGAHFLLSLAIALGVFALVYFTWYPWGLFEVAGGRALFTLIVAVDVVVGPLLTFVVFVPGKRGLAFDLAVIAVLQLSSLAYGLSVLHESRPAFLVFAKDRFELLRANDLEAAELARARPPFSQIPLTGPLVAGVEFPKDQAEMDTLVFAASSGVDISSFPRYYVPYDRVRADVVRHAGSIAALRKLNAANGGEVEAALAAAALPEANIRFLPVRAGKIDLTALIDARDASVLRVVALRPWEFK